MLSSLSFFFGLEERSMSSRLLSLNRSSSEHLLGAGFTGFGSSGSTAGCCTGATVAVGVTGCCLTGSAGFVCSLLNTSQP